MTQRLNHSMILDTYSSLVLVLLYPDTISDFVIKHEHQDKCLLLEEGITTTSLFKMMKIMLSISVFVLVLAVSTTKLCVEATPADEHVKYWDDAGWGSPFAQVFNNGAYYVLRKHDGNNVHLKPSLKPDHSDADARNIIRKDDGGGNIVKDRRYHWRFIHIAGNAFCMVNRGLGKPAGAMKRNGSGDWYFGTAIYDLDDCGKSSSTMKVLIQPMARNNNDEGIWKMHVHIPSKGWRNINYVSEDRAKLRPNEAQSQGGTEWFYIDQVNAFFPPDTDTSPSALRNFQVMQTSNDIARMFVINIVWAIPYGVGGKTDSKIIDAVLRYMISTESNDSYRHNTFHFSTLVCWYCFAVARKLDDQITTKVCKRDQRDDR